MTQRPLQASINRALLVAGTTFTSCFLFSLLTIFYFVANPAFNLLLVLGLIMVPYVSVSTSAGIVNFLRSQKDTLLNPSDNWTNYLKAVAFLALATTLAGASIGFQIGFFAPGLGSAVMTGVGAALGFAVVAIPVVAVLVTFGVKALLSLVSKWWEPQQENEVKKPLVVEARYSHQITHEIIDSPPAINQVHPELFTQPQSVKTAQTTTQATFTNS